MAAIRGILVLALLGVLSGCSPLESPTSTPTTVPSAKSGFGGPDPAAVSVTEETFQTPSKNIVCALTSSEVRCDIAQKEWSAPAKPADCELDWGNGLVVTDGEAAYSCAGDTLLGSARTTLQYGSALRAGTVRCDSASSGLTCKDEETAHGFTMATAKHRLF
ncbi:hypothetical protein Aab01nite_18200 [Paractinoplanes abujensis]|uniref:Ig-like domain-containing protein n=1 Tax=Paractinoplanes abujensis TaxID=882441 RepID=A0A7W7CZI9_9ACTN|nr:DUF6636 domain-containing protein [Actinoplanes abujensis]MBB4697294.1 hypothetical protein [Actinoplanes abujensis]GID18230.1 hypothetical protein Aab01nite_18200 [Actinoplanes abujensis]